MAWPEKVDPGPMGRRGPRGLSGQVSRLGGVLSLGMLVWIVMAAISLGTLVYLLAIESPEDTLKAATLPILLLLLQVSVLLLRLPSQYGPVIILAAAAFIPVSLPTGTASRLVDSLVLTAIFLGVWLVKRLLTEGRLSLRPSPVNLPLVIFMVVTVVSWVWSQVFRDPLVVIWSTFPMVQAASAVVMILLPVAFLLVANTIHDEKTLRTMSLMMIVAGFLGLARHLLMDSIPVNTNGLFNMWVLAIAAGWALFNRRSAWWVRAAMVVLVGFWLLWSFGFNASWLAGWLPGMVALAVVTWRRSGKWLLVFCLLLAIAIIFNTDYLERTLEAEMQTSLLTRIDAWQQNWLVTREHILFGTGPGGYAAYYVSYFPTRAMASHNNYIDVVAQTGMIGLITFVWFLLALVRLGIRVSRRLRGRGDFLEAIGVATLGGTIGTVVIAGFGDWLLPFAYTQGINGFDHAVYSWLFMGMILVIDRLALAAPTEIGVKHEILGF